MVRGKAAEVPPARRRRDLAATRQALVDAAEAAFAERGFDSASLEDIATRAGFTRGAIYHQFASKHELFLEVIRRHDERLLAAYEDLLSAGAPPDPATGTQRWRDVHEHDDVTVALRLELRSQALRDPALRTEFAALDGAAVAATAERLEGMERRAGRSKVPVGDIAELLHIVSQAALERSALTGEDKAHLMTSMLEILWGSRD